MSVSEKNSRKETQNMTNKNKIILDLITSIQETKSKERLNNDIKRIQKKLNKLELEAEVSRESIRKMQKKLSRIKIKAEIMPESVQNLFKQLETIAEKHSIHISAQETVNRNAVSQEEKAPDSIAVLKQVQKEQAVTEKSGRSLFSSLKKGTSSVSQLISPHFLFMELVPKVKEAFTELKKVDGIMTEISKVSRRTSEELKTLGEEAYGTASRYGRTVSDYLTGVQEMSRAGFQGDKAEEMAELSLLVQTAAGMSTELSNEYLIAANTAYKLNGETGKLNEILDGQYHISNNNAVSMEHLASATKAAASQAAGAGVAVDEMSAAVGTMAAVTQDGGETAGRAFKALLMNIRQVPGELEDGDVINEESLVKYEEACKNLGVSLKTVRAGVVSLRDPMEVLKELSEAYSSLDQNDARRTDLITAVGGKQKGNQVNALLENWSIYEKLLNDYSKGSGSAMEDAKKSADNWEGSLNRLQNTWVNTIENIANSDVAVTVINGTNSLLEVLNKLTATLGSIGTIGLGAFAFLNKGRSNTILPCRVATPYSKF